MFHNLPEIRSPAAEIVVGEDHGNTRDSGLSGEIRNPIRDLHRGIENLFTSGPFQIVDHVDHQESNRGCVGSVAMKIVIFA
ncbi:hypothetical protein BH23GEM6_BH23GEM6_19460 [soil metagenome]